MKRGCTPNEISTVYLCSSNLVCWFKHYRKNIIQLIILHVQLFITHIGQVCLKNCQICINFLTLTTSSLQDDNTRNIKSRFFIHSDDSSRIIIISTQCNIDIVRWIIIIKLLLEMQNSISLNKLNKNLTRFFHEVLLNLFFETFQKK